MIPAGACARAADNGPISPHLRSFQRTSGSLPGMGIPTASASILGFDPLHLLAIE
jgi:hypothetical protein